MNGQARGESPMRVLQRIHVRRRFSTPLPQDLASSQADSRTPIARAALRVSHGHDRQEIVLDKVDNPIREARHSLGAHHRIPLPVRPTRPSIRVIAGCLNRVVNGILLTRTDAGLTLVVPVDIGYELGPRCRVEAEGEAHELKIIRCARPAVQLGGWRAQRTPARQEWSSPGR